MLIGSWAYEVCCFWLVNFSILPNRVIIQYLNTPIEEKGKIKLLQTLIIILSLPHLPLLIHSIIIRFLSLHNNYLSFFFFWVVSKKKEL